MAPALVENVSHTAANSEQMRAFIKKIFAEPDWNELFSFFFFLFPFSDLETAYVYFLECEENTVHAKTRFQ